MPNDQRVRVRYLSKGAALGFRTRYLSRGTIRPLWRHYYANSAGVVFVVDSNDPQRLQEVRLELHTVVGGERMADSVRVYSPT